MTRAALLIALILSSAHPGHAAGATTLAAGGAAAQKIVVAKTTTDAVRTQAERLAEYLHRISGATFAVELGDGTQGLAVGVAGDFPSLKLDVSFDPADA